MNLNTFKFAIFPLIGLIGYRILDLFGGLNVSLTTLIVVMTVDYITGMILCVVFQKSPKTKTGTLRSDVGWKGLFRKYIILLMVLLGVQFDIFFNVSFIRESIIIAYIVNELISIIENIGLMGIPVPKVISNIVDVLKSKNDEK